MREYLYIDDVVVQCWLLTTVLILWMMNLICNCVDDPNSAWISGKIDLK